MSSYDVAVIGLGAMGSAAFFHLARRGRKVIGLEQFQPGHDKGSSHGESRAIRLSYFEHPSYVPLLRRAFESWRELEALCREPVFTANGILEAGYPGNSLVGGSRQASLLHDLDHTMLTGAEVNRRFPAFRLPDNWEALYQPQGGFVRPETAIHAYVRLGTHHGGTVQTGTRVLAIEPRGSGIAIRTEHETIEAGAVVVAAGAWIGELVPELRRHLTVTRQVIGWFEPVAPALVALDAFPTFLLRAEDDSYYGFPNFAGTGVKAGSHNESGILPSADALEQDAGPRDEARIRRLFSRYIPAADGPLNAMRTCLYTRTLDEDFVIDRAPVDPRIILASPCSGHGFKFASVLGEVLADLAEARNPVFDLGRFRIDRLGSPSGMSVPA